MDAMEQGSMLAEPFVSRGGMGTEQVLVVDDAMIEGTLSTPLGARAIIVIPHASSAGRFGPSSHFVSQVLQQAGLATFQVDLLTPGEEAGLRSGKHGAQDTQLLVKRSLAVVEWLQSHPVTRTLAVGVFASTTETIAASLTAERSTAIRAIVSEGGYPDMFDETLTSLPIPTLLIVGSDERARAPELASEFFARHLLR